MIINGSLKWFCTKKGYGFIQSEANPDAMIIHERLPYVTLPIGSEVTVEAIDNRGKLFVDRILSIDRLPPVRLPPCEVSRWYSGTIKWWSVHAQHGWIAVPGMRRDIYINDRVRRDCGLWRPKAGMQVNVRFTEDERGPFTVALKVEPQNFAKLIEIPEPKMEVVE